jgi:nucleotide-binding universal stress UspA family protein
MKTTPATKSRARQAKSLRRAPRRPATSRPRIVEMVPRVLRIRRILVPFDFSKPAEKALRYAVSFARQSGAKISLLHVQPIPYYPMEMGYLPVGVPVSEPSAKTLREQLTADARRLVPGEMLDRTLLRTGTAFDEICRAARESRTDLIIIATHGYTGLQHVLLGSTAERVVRHAPCPVLIVRETEREFA